MRRLIPATLLLLAASTAIAASERPATGPSPSAEVESILKTQAQAWTRGDLEAFCWVYADDATFITPSGMTRGRQAVLDRYRAKYKDKAGMGALALEMVEVHAFAPTDVVTVVARWTLTWPDRPKAEGLTLLVLTRTKDGWRIVQDASM